jgi:hypothetical protein
MSPSPFLFLLPSLPLSLHLISFSRLFPLASFPPSFHLLACFQLFTISKVLFFHLDGYSSVFSLPVLLLLLLLFLYVCVCQTEKIVLSNTNDFLYIAVRVLQKNASIIVSLPSPSFFFLCLAFVVPSLPIHAASFSFPLSSFFVLFFFSNDPVSLSFLRVYFLLRRVFSSAFSLLPIFPLFSSLSPFRPSLDHFSSICRQCHAFYAFTYTHTELIV